ncbi:unnamed protein product [Parnassius apollo]|uniref:(apollo) hypothetical protein n=1 Tax=Parnassius apollo TaxID=110799 RepID=A0A8S3WU55_PARAO|nr:unnamed protein product [Parnassius apollo]
MALMYLSIKHKRFIGAQEEFNKFYSKWLLKRSPVRVGATISEISTTQTTTDMVFSQTSLQTRSILKVVDIDLLKAEKSQQVNGSTGVVTHRNTVSEPSSPEAATSYPEEFPKPEPELPSTMFHESDCEFFQDLVQWCAAPAEDVVVQSIDSPKHAENRALTTDTLHTPISPQGWDVFDANSPSTPANFYYSMSNPVSPSVDGLAKYSNDLWPQQNDKVPFTEEFLDISNLPVVIGESASSKKADMKPWQVTEPIGWLTSDTDYTKPNTNTHPTLPFIAEESSDIKLVSVIPREVENNDVVISEYIINDYQDSKEMGKIPTETMSKRRGRGLSIDVAACAPKWPVDIISTPEVLNYVEQLEEEKCSHASSTPAPEWPAQESSVDSVSKTESSPPMEYDPITPKTESHVESDNDDTKSYSSKKRRRDSEDSDETYTPYTEHSPRKYRRRKPDIPIKDMIRALEGSQQLKPTRRGRPPKRRESTVSSVCSMDDSSSVSTHELRYRELRDKNNEASKRSRMNRKLKELQMEQLAIELEERNKKLRIRAEILEDTTKKLREAFMSAVSQKRLNS